MGLTREYIMTPEFQIIADGNDITSAIRKGLLSLNVSDEAGITSDKVEIRLDDSKGIIALPRTGAELEVFIGYKETGLVRMGLYVVDEVLLSGEAKTLGIRARAANMRKSLKSPKTRSWDKVTLGNMVERIASEHGLTPRISEEFANLAVEHVDQTESDLNLLTRLARQHDAAVKPVGEFLVFVPKGQAKTAAGVHIPNIMVNVKEITSWSATFAERGKYGAVVGEYHNAETAVKENVKVGSGEPVFTLRHNHSNADEAKQAAKAQLERFTRGTGTLQLTAPGNTRFMAEGKIEVTGVRTGVDGQWMIKKVDHNLDGNGYSCRIDAETPKK